MKSSTYLAIVVIFLFSLVSESDTTPTQEPDWARKDYYSLVDGNGLYAECQSADKNIKLGEGGAMSVRTGAEVDLFAGGMCWGYIRAVVDSIPAGEGFEPDKNVRLNQYVDVVLAYLRDNPNLRHQSAYGLTRNALAIAFPAGAKRPH